MIHGLCTNKPAGIDLNKSLYDIWIQRQTFNDVSIRFETAGKLIWDGGISWGGQSNLPAAGAKPALSWYALTLYTLSEVNSWAQGNDYMVMLTWSILSNISKPLQNQRRSPPSIERGLKEDADEEGEEEQGSDWPHKDVTSIPKNDRCCDKKPQGYPDVLVRWHSASARESGGEKRKRIGTCGGVS